MHSGLIRTSRRILIGVAIFAAACSSTLRVRTDYDRSVDFKKYRTFAIREGNSTGNPVMDRRIHEDLAAALRAKGLDEVRLENADALFVPHAATSTRRSYDTFYDRTWDGWRWRGRPTVVVTQFEVGTIVVDMFDARTKDAVWHAYVASVLHDDPEKDAAQTDQAIREIFDRYPA